MSIYLISVALSTMKVNQDDPGVIVLSVLLIQGHLSMLPRVGVCCQVFKFKPHKKLKIKMIPRSYTNFPKRYRPIFLVKVVQNASGEKF